MIFNSNSSEILTPINIQMLAILPYASIIEQTYSDYLLPPKQGIYKFGDLKPSIYNNRMYYVQQKMGNTVIRVPVTDFNTVEDTIVDEMDRIVIPSFMMKQKTKYLFNTPTIPARGAEIIKLLIEHHLASTSSWANKGNYIEKMCSFFKPENSEIVEELFLQRLCESLLCQVSNFVGNDSWNVYFVKFLGLDLCIEKCIDYRIYDWTLKEQQRLEDGLL